MRILAMLVALAMSIAVIVGGVFLIVSIPPEPQAATVRLPPALGFAGTYPNTRALMIHEPIEVGVPRADQSGVYDYVPLGELQQLVQERKASK